MSDVQARIAEDVKSNDVLLYMKGTPAFPQCGFSAVTVQILSHVGAKFKAVNVLEDPEVREGIKSFSNSAELNFGGAEGGGTEVAAGALVAVCAETELMVTTRAIAIRTGNNALRMR